MDQKAFEHRVERLELINTELLKLDPTIRAQAFEVLRDYVIGGVQPRSASLPSIQTAPIDDDGAGNGEVDRDSFFAAHSSDKPAENVFSISAFLYSEYGASPITASEIRSMGDDVGVTVPARVDKTLNSARREGKSLFKTDANGAFLPTVHGELYFQKEFGVKKGKKSKPAEQP